jgi:hypothetical protein
MLGVMASLWAEVVRVGSARAIKSSSSDGGGFVAVRDAMVVAVAQRSSTGRCDLGAQRRSSGDVMGELGRIGDGELIGFLFW